MLKKLTVFIVLTFILLVIWLNIPTKSDNINQGAVSNSAISIDVHDILNNPELKQGVLTAVKQNNTAEIVRLQNKAIEIGLAADFNQVQMQRLQGQKARDFLIFRAKRQLFYQEFSEKYQNLDGIDALKKKYPEAQSLFSQADLLIEKRNAIIIEIAKVLAGGNQDYRQFIDEAKAQWRSRQQSSLPELE